MLRGGRFPDSQAEIVFGDAFVEYLGHLHKNDQIAVLAEVVQLCDNPAGKHPLSGHLARWNTVDVLGGEHRVIFSSRVVGEVGTIEVLCAGPRKADAVYGMAQSLIGSGHLTDEDVEQIWISLQALNLAAEKVGLDGWDYAPEPAPAGMQKAAIAAGVVDADMASVLSTDELEAAMTEGWGTDGSVDPARAVDAILRRARSNPPVGGANALADRAAPRCTATMPRARRPCVRRSGHPGAHRAT